MSTVASPIIKESARIPTWFRVGGRADRLARPVDMAQLGRLLGDDPGALVLGDGANLLVDDGGVRRLVISLRQGEFVRTTIDGESGRVVAGAGANLPRLILDTARAGLGGLEALGGIPATVGGAVRMNAGGAFGEIADFVSRVHAVRRDGSPVTLEREQIAFGYRCSGLEDLVITGAEFALTPGDGAAVRERLKEIMAWKKNSQPLGSDSAGCVFKNPLLERDVPGIGEKGTRVSAGLLIDRAGCKGVSVRGAAVSGRHANFIVTSAGATARDVLELMRIVRGRVRDAFGVAMEREIVVWGAPEELLS